MNKSASSICVMGMVIASLSACEKKEAPVAPAPSAATPSPHAPATAPSAPAPSPQAPMANPHQGMGSFANPPMTSGGDAAQVAPDGTSLTVGGVHASIPNGWSSVPPANSMRLAELRCPDAGNDASKSCTTTFVIASGDVEANVARWAGQMADAQGKVPTYQIVNKTLDGLPVATVEMIGSFAGMGEGPVRDNWMLRGAIIDGPEGQLFIKMTGPVDAMKAAGEGWSAMIESLKKAN